MEGARRAIGILPSPNSSAQEPRSHNQMERVDDQQYESNTLEQIAGQKP